MDIASSKIPVIGIVGGYIASMFGGWSTDLQALLIFMGIDFAMGLMVAGIFKKSGKTQSGALQSNAAWIGLSKKVVTLMLVLVAHQLDISIGLNFIRTAVIICFMVNETISITENAGLMGAPIPAPLVKAIEILKSKSEKGGK